MPISFNNGDPGVDIRAKINGGFGIESGALADPYELTFNVYHRIRTLAVDDDIELALASSGMVSNTFETIIATGDGASMLTFPSDWVMQGDTFNPNKVHAIDFRYIGGEVVGVVSIIAAAPIAPEIVSAEIYGATTQRIRVTFDYAVDATTAGWSISASGGAATLSAVSGSGTLVLDFTPSRTISDSETVTISYDPGTGDTVKVSDDVELGTVTAQAVTNNVYSIDLDVPFTGTTVDTSKGTITNPDSANLLINQNGVLRQFRNTDTAVAGSTTNYWNSVATFTRGVISAVMNKTTGFTNSITYFQYWVDSTHHISILKLNGQSNVYLRITNGTDTYTFQSAVSSSNRFRIEYNSSNEIRFKYWTGTAWADIDVTNPVHTVNIGSAGNVRIGANSSASDAASDLFTYDEVYVTSKPYPTVTPS